jgi:DNA-binding transcriptional ArsR family regulator
MRKRPPVARTRSSAGAPPLQASVSDLRALAHPLRLRILELFAEAPRTTKQVAELLGQPPTRLYHHVAALERAGLLVLKETRPNRGVVEKWYEAVARQMEAPRSHATLSAKRAGAGVRRALAMTVLEQARQEMMRAVSPAKQEGPLLVRLMIAAPAETMPVFRSRLLAAVKDIQRELAGDNTAESTDDCERWALTLAFAPASTAVEASPTTKRRRKRR